MFVFGFFFIASGFNRHYQKDWKQNKEEVPPAEEGGPFLNLWSRLFGDQGDKAALKEKESTNPSGEHVLINQGGGLFDPNGKFVMPYKDAMSHYGLLTGDICLVMHEFLHTKFPKVNTAEKFREVRDYVKERGGLDCIRTYLSAKRLIKGDVYDHKGPFNAHARYGNGMLTESSADNHVIYPKDLFKEDQEALGKYGGVGGEFVLARNLWDADHNWDKKKPGKNDLPSMSRRHRFLDIKNQNWKWFNVVAFGLDPKDLPVAIRILREAKDAAEAYVQDSRKEDRWNKEAVKHYVHCFGHNSVQSFHMHIVDTSETGDSYDLQQHKNLPVDAVLEVLEAELDASQKEYEQKEYGETSSSFDLQ